MLPGEAAVSCIDRLRVEQGLSTYALSYLSGVPISTIKDITARRSHGMTLETICRLCKALDKELVEFFAEPEFKQIVLD